MSGPSEHVRLGEKLEGSLVLLPTDRLRRHANARPLDDAAVAALEESIGQVGLLNPIRVQRPILPDGTVDTGGDYEVVAGHHRFAACELIGWREIPCIVVASDDLRAELAMIDENLCRAELSPSERAQQTARRKAIYLELHPETAVGENQHTRVRQVGEGSDAAERFTASTAKATGQSERAVQRDAERGEKVIPEVMEMIRGTKLDSGVYLDKIKRLPPNEQVHAVKRDLAIDRQQTPKPQGGIAARVEQKPEPTYEQLREAILFLADLTPADFNRLCPPQKRSAMFQKLAHLEQVFEQVREAASA